MDEVAKTYSTWERKGRPFSDDGKRYYIIVINPKTQKEKTVRWYGTVTPDYKHIFGFDKGYITIFKGVNHSNWQFFSESNARYANFFGWYIVSTEDVPQLPEGVTAIQLPWNDAFIDVTARKTAVEKLIGRIYDEQ